MDWEFVVAGLFTGLLVGMTGIGGSLMTPILVFLFGIPPSTAIGTYIAHGAAFKTGGAVEHRRMGNVRARLAGWMLVVDFGILFWLLLGFIPGVQIGGRLTLSIPEQRLRLLLAGVLGLAGIKLLNVPFAGTIVVVVLSAGAVVLPVWLARHSWIRFVRGRGAAAPSPAE